MEENKNIPQKREKYYHFKSVGGEDHLYEIVGLGTHTETKEILVVYRPLYKSEYLKEKLSAQAGSLEYFIRPLSNFLEYVDRDGYKGPRFFKA